MQTVSGLDSRTVVCYSRLIAQVLLAIIILNIKLAGGYYGIYYPTCRSDG